MYIPMKRIQIHDKTFEISILNEEIRASIRRIGMRINDDLKGKTPVFVCILNGSFMFAADLLKEITLPCEVSFVKMASYAGTKSSGYIKELIGFNENLKGRTVVIVEDIVDSGNTMEEIMVNLKELGVEEVKIATLILKPEAYKKNIPLDYVGLSISNEFIVGYGLDYDGHGRNLKDIYKNIEN
jgi:hypoxanthine phosphoribosyltransferase